MERRRRWERSGEPEGGRGRRHDRDEGEAPRRREGGDLRPFRDRLLELAGRQALSHDLVLVDVELTLMGRRSVMRVLVDRPGGVTVGECSGLSRDLSTELDALDLIPFGYQLEVSSPGLGRPFRLPEQYRWSIGRRVKVSLRDPLGEVRSLEGTLVEVREGSVLVRVDEGQEHEVPFGNIREACRVVEI